MQIELNEPERAFLAHILREYLSDLRVEIGNTDSSEFKEHLRDDRGMAVELLAKLEGNGQG